MRYLVMECGFSYAVVLDQQGRFLKVANLGYAVGQTVDSVIPFQEERKKSRTSRRVIPVLAAAACLCLVFLGGFQYILSPYGTVRIQINPDVMISVNRWDYAVDVEGMNDDGEELVEDYHYIGKKVDQVSDELADRAVDQGFLKEGDQITLTVESEHEDWKTATEDLLITELTIHLDSSVEIRTAGEAEEEMEREKQELVNKYALELKSKEEMIEYYKDMKLRLSTKMLGETLEQHCEIQFNQLRATGFQNSYFEKDNDARSGSKGDFIFREASDGVELLSIMFEMKNEMDTTATKHKNEDFFKELDKDRREKGCEYAILVSLLEPESELYDGGIVDVSYRYPKMYVIRPQFFLPMITLLRNAALRSLDARRELHRIQSLNLDATRFEANLMTFKDAVSRNYDLASRNFQTALDEIDKSIDHLQKVRKALVSSERNLRLLNDKTEDLSIRKLTKDSPGIRAEFEAQGVSVK